MILKKLLQLFGVVKKKKDSKKKGKSIDPLWQAAAPHSTVNVIANNSLLDPCSSGTDMVLSLEKHELECSSIASSMIRTEHGSDTDDYKSFNQFDVVQDFSDHHYAKNSPGKTTKDWVKTIQNEWKLLQKDLPSRILRPLLCVTSTSVSVSFWMHAVHTGLDGCWIIDQVWREICLRQVLCRSQEVTGYIHSTSHKGVSHEQDSCAGTENISTRHRRHR